MRGTASCTWEFVDTVCTCDFISFPFSCPFSMSRAGLLCFVNNEAEKTINNKKLIKGKIIIFPVRHKNPSGKTSSGISCLGIVFL